MRILFAACLVTFTLCSFLKFIPKAEEAVRLRMLMSIHTESVLNLSSFFEYGICNLNKIDNPFTQNISKLHSELNAKSDLSFQKFNQIGNYQLLKPLLTSKLPNSEKSIYSFGYLLHNPSNARCFGVIK